MKDLKKRRLKANLTIAQLACRVGCGKAYICTIERGDYIPSADICERIEAALSGKRPKIERTPEQKLLHEAFVRDFAPERKREGNYYGV